MNKFSWFLSLMPPLLAIIILRTYLGYFDNVSLFTENLTVAGIFNFVFIFMILTTAGFSIIFFSSSILFALFIPKKSPTIHNYREVKIKITVTTLSSIPLIVLFFFGWAYLSTFYPAFGSLIAWAAFIAWVTLVFLVNYFFMIQPVRNAQGYQPIKLRRKTYFILLGGCLVFILFIVALSFSFSFGTIISWVDKKTAGDSLAVMLKLAVLATGLGILLILPGVIYANLEEKELDNVWFIRISAAMILLWPMLISTFVPSFFPMLVDKTLSFGGVSDWKSRYYQIDESKIPSSHFGSKVWQTSVMVSGKSYSVKGMLVYSLNNAKLLCPDSVQQHYRNMLRFVPWDREYDKRMALKLKDVSTRCQPFPQGGVVRLSEKS